MAAIWDSAAWLGRYSFCGLGDIPSVILGKNFFDALAWNDCASHHRVLTLRARTATTLSGRSWLRLPPHGRPCDTRHRQPPGTQHEGWRQTRAHWGGRSVRPVAQVPHATDL